MIELEHNHNKTATGSKTIPVLATQHFDILWRKSFAYYRDKQKEVIDKVLDIMDEYPDFRFAFQQANVLRYYAEHNAENFDRFKKAVAAGQIEIVGGLEAIPDSNIPGGESIVRNILYGLQWVSRTFGARPQVATMLDTFGSSGQLPQILSRMGYKAFLSGRMPGADFPKTGVTSLFIWKGIDGSDIAGINCEYASIPQASLGAWYGWGVLEGFDKEYASSPLLPEVFKKDIIDGLHNFSQFSESEKNIVAVISGEEHLPRTELVEALKEFNDQDGSTAFMSRFDDFVKNADWSGVDRLEGEYNVEFTGCYTTRIELKQLSRLAEQMLYANEFLRSCDVPGSGRDISKMSNIPELWRKLALCQFHDAVCGCHIDENYYHIIKAFDDIIQGCKSDISVLTASVAKENDAENVVVININPFDITETAEVRTGGRRVLDAKGEPLPVQSDGDKTYILAKIKPGCIETYSIGTEKIREPLKYDYLPCEGIRAGRFSVKQDAGLLSIRDMITGRDMFSENMPGGRLVLKHENGTLWTENYTGNQLAEVAGQGRIESIEAGELFVKITLCGEFEPSLVGWSLFGKLQWRKSIYVHRFLDRLEVDLEIDYEGKETEVCIEFDCDVKPAGARARYEIPFGSIVREPYGPDKYRLGRGNWPALSWVDYSDDECGFAFVHTGTPGCLVNDGKVSFSLLRSATDYNEPLFPAKPEPLSFNNGTHSYRFAVIPHFSRDLRWLREAGSFAKRPLTAPVCGDSLAVQGLGITIDAPNVILSSLKPAEDGNGIIARVYEIIGSESEFAFGFNKDWKIFETGMDESSDISEAVCGPIVIGPFEVKTFRLLPA